MSQNGENRVAADEVPTLQLTAVSATPTEDRPTIQITSVSWPADQPGAGPVLHRPPAAERAAEAAEEPPRRNRRRALLAGGIAVAVLAAVGGTAGYAYAGDVPRGTTVLGVELGGKSQAEAVRLLRAELDRRASTLTAPVEVRIGDRAAKISPAAVGLAVDVEATVAAARDQRPNPVRRLFGSRAVQPVVTVDAQRLDAELRRVFGAVGQRMTLPAITFNKTTPKATYPKPGQDIRADESARALRDGWLSGQPVVVPLVEIRPATTAEEVDRLIAELARPAVAAPVTVTTERGEFTIPPAAIAKSLVLTADSAGRIKPRVDAKKLRAALADRLDKVEIAPKNASMSIQGGKPRVVAGKGGRQVDLAALGRDLLPVLSRADGRQVTATLKDVQPEITAEELGKLGIKEKVSSFTTRFTGGLSSPRSQNIVTIAREVDGALVKPGQTFSLNGHTGERGYAQGYRDAPVIVDGKLVPGVGGGTSQFTTTLFNAIYYAGLEDVEHKPHSYWFSRYPPVIESTIFWPDLDFKFRNNTPYGVLIDTSYTSNSVTVSIWSTKVWDKVTTEWSARRNITKPRVIKLEPGPSCIPTNGIDGFTQDAWRLFHRDGKVVKREKFTWTYKAEPRYVCGR